MQIELITFPFLFLATWLLLNKLKAFNFLSKVQGIIKVFSAEANVSVCVLSTVMPVSSQSTANHWIGKIKENYQTCQKSVSKFTRSDKLT